MTQSKRPVGLFGQVEQDSTPNQGASPKLCQFFSAFLSSGSGSVFLQFLQSSLTQIPYGNYNDKKLEARAESTGPTPDSRRQRHSYRLELARRGRRSSERCLRGGDPTDQLASSPAPSVSALKLMFRLGLAPFLRAPLRSCCRRHQRQTREYCA